MKFKDIRFLRTVPDPVLRTIANEVKHFDPDGFSGLIDRMREVMGQYNGVGIAAPQIGVSQRLFLFIHEDQVMLVVNPLITMVSEEMQVGEEGCLSCPGETVLIPRHLGVELSGQAITGEHFSCRWTGLPARIIQHEVDHLNGRLILDYKK